MFDNLSDKLEKALHVLKGHGQITEINVAETLKEVRRALLDADVNYAIAKDFTAKVKAKALGANVLTTLQPGQLMVKIVRDELTELMGGDATGVNLSGNPSVILVKLPSLENWPTSSKPKRTKNRSWLPATSIVLLQLTSCILLEIR